MYGGGGGYGTVVVVVLTAEAATAIPYVLDMGVNSAPPSLLCPGLKSELTCFAETD